ncbi:transcriptional regulator, LysR family [Polaromonas sp. OV174]|nr:transcriptional regulator, LysR family [Polaromonas sp. OV174]
MYFNARMSYIHAMRRKIPSTQALLAFEAAAHRGSFTLAAQDLSVSQSAVSHQVLGLEQDLDVSLFLRLPRQLELTDAGRSLLSRVSPALDALEAAMLDLASSKGEGGTLELGVVPTFATKWLIPRLPDFLKAHPYVTLNLSTRLLPFDFSLTGLDAAIHYGRPDWPGTASEYLMGEESVVVCSPALLSQRLLQHPADVLKFTLIHQSTRAQAWVAWLRLAGVDDTPAASVGPKYELFSMIAQAVKAGLGLAVLPRFLVADDIADGTLAVPFELPLSSDFAYYLVWPTQKAHWRPLLQLRAWLREQALADRPADIF